MTLDEYADALKAQVRTLTGALVDIAAAVPGHSPGLWLMISDAIAAMDGDPRDRVAASKRDTWPDLNGTEGD